MIKRIPVAAALALAMFLIAAVPCALLTPAAAQFDDQATFAGTGAGTANAQTITLANASSYADLVGVAVKYTPSATNTGDATLTVNGFGSSPSFRKPNGAGVTALTGGEIVSGQPTMIMYDGTYFNLLAPAGLPVGASQLQSSSISYGTPTNLAISASVATNALTIALKGADGNDPSATNPILVSFRNVTIATGSPSVVSITSPLSFTIASTSTMGCVSGQMCRLWIVLFNNSGTSVLGAFNALSGTNVAPINEAALQTCASGTSGGSSAQTYYCSTSAVTAKAIKIIGYVEIQEVTAGTWATGPTYVQLFGPGIKKPGDTVQVVTGSTTTVGSTASATFAALTSGQSLSIVPSSAANIIRADARGSISLNVAGQGFLQIVRTISAVTTVLGNPIENGDASSGSFQYAPASILVYDTPNSVGSVAYSFQGKTTTGTVSYPAANSGSILELKEIMSSVDPANDNGTPDRRMVG